MKKEQKASLVHDFRLGKGQRHAYKTGEALAQRSIPAFHMSGFPCFFAYSRVLLLGNHTSIYFQKVCKAMCGLTISLSGIVNLRNSVDEFSPLRPSSI
jgi:hypothetical protein